MIRSEFMTLCQVIDHNDAARRTVELLGELGLAQIKDLNPGLTQFKRAFADDVRRCADLNRRLDFLSAQLQSVGMTAVAPENGVPTEPVSALEGTLKAAQLDLTQLKSQEDQIRRVTNAAREHLHVLTLGASVYSGSLGSGSGAPAAPQSGLRAPLMSSAHSTGAGPAGAAESMLNVVAGVCARETAMPLVRAIYRASRGNCVVHDVPIDEPLLVASEGRAGGELVAVPKNFFMVFFSGSVLDAKVQKIATHYGASVYTYQESADARQAQEAKLRVQLVELRELETAARGQRRKLLRSVALKLSGWRRGVLREMATIHSLNLLQLDFRRKVFVAQLWVPTAQVAQLHDALQAGALAAGGETKPIVSVLDTKETPPTSIRTNKFTKGFQGLVDTYGIPRYREVNPGAFAVILFPFLFAIMFGDVGHGSLLLLLALGFIAFEERLLKTKLDDIVGMAFGGRYVLLLNALFAIYVGFIYNEAFSVPLGLFKSAYHEVVGADGASTVEWDGSVYAFGVDPMWHRSTNKMTFFNSYKMKVSIVFGVAQMALGIVLSFFNTREFKDPRSFYFGVVPELVFFGSIFGYLVFMIMRKWSIDWVEAGESPPSLLNTLIAMFMSPGVYTEAGRLFPGQEYLQLVLVLVAVIAVPFLLLPKPLLFLQDQKKAAAAKAAAGEPLAPSAEEGGEHGEEEEEEEDFSEVFVHQVIHTIEFVLGSISNTASYLRLWALSLAHSQLSELFWEKVMVGGAFPAAKLPTPLNGIAIFAAFTVWFILNLGVIMVMENLSSFLHALRLQWVEFQNKFYKGDGYRFVPFSYARIDSGAEDDD